MCANDVCECVDRLTTKIIIQYTELHKTHILTAPVTTVLIILYKIELRYYSKQTIIEIESIWGKMPCIHSLNVHI